MSLQENPNSPRDGRRNARQKSAQRSRVGNGSALLSGQVDGRSVWCRRLKEKLADYYGSDYPDSSIAERSIIRRASVLEIELEALELKFAQAGQANADDLDLYQRTAGNLR